MSKEQHLDRLDALRNEEQEFASTKALLGQLVQPMMEDMNLTPEQTDAVIQDMTAAMLPKAFAANRQARSEIFTEEDLAVLADFGEANPSILNKFVAVFTRSTEINKFEPKDILTIVAKNVPHMRDEIAAMLAEQ